MPAAAGRGKGYGSRFLSAGRWGPLSLRQHFEVLDSTQRLAVDAARTGAPEGFFVVADRQEAGRGRLDRSWASPPGGLYLSLLLREPRRGLPLVPLAVGLAVAEALAPFSLEPLLKWPNDLVVARPPGPPRKLGGILLDRVPSPALGSALVAGIGVNVETPADEFPPALRARLIHLSELAGRPVAISEVERAVVPAVLATPATLETAGGPEAVLARIRARLYGRGRPARLDGRRVGVIEDLAEDGTLVLADGAVRTHVQSGDIVVEEA